MFNGFNSLLQEFVVDILFPAQDMYFTSVLMLGSWTYFQHTHNFYYMTGSRTKFPPHLQTAFNAVSFNKSPVEFLFAKQIPMKLGQKILIKKKMEKIYQNSKQLVKP